MKFQFTTPPDLGGPTLRLPMIPLLLGWMMGSLGVLGGGAVLGSSFGATGPEITAGILGASIAVVV
ncbi:MAG: hypothetical protein MK085_02160, partial [Phycisphaerales bacterium]|nr:hypothetical protein [Phycisphaerales bacterium]